MRGRKPVPPHLRVLQGNAGKRGVARDVREQAKSVARDKRARTARVGSAPAWLDASARSTWRRIVGEKGLAWLESVDREMLATFCSTYARMVAATKAIATHGMTYETVNGGIGTRPEVRIANQCAATVRSLGAELGLSPTARARLGSTPAPPRSADELPPELKRGPNAGGA